MTTQYFNVKRIFSTAGVRSVGFVFLFGILLQTAFAQFPVIWERGGLEDSSGYGRDMIAFGDYYDDGHTDFAIGAFSVTPTYPYDDYIEFFHGGSPPSANPFRIWYPDTTTQWKYGNSFAVGDFNGDGDIDWLIEMHQLPSLSESKSMIFFDGPNDTTPNLTWMQPGTRNPEPIGDFNGDGYDDLYIRNVSEDEDDWAKIYFGSANPDTIADWEMHSPVGHRYQATGLKGYGDLNGDGCSDFVTTTPDPENLLHIILGGAEPDTFVDTIWEDYTFPYTAVVNDLNGDGRDEIIVGWNPTIFVHFGRANVSDIHQEPDVTLNFGCISDQFFSLGDINGDEFKDMGAIGTNCTSFGKMAIYLGYHWLNPDPVFQVLGSHPALIGIREITALGDINGDGYDDWGMNAFDQTYPLGMRGKVRIYAGAPVIVSIDLPELTPSDFEVSVYPNPFNAIATVGLHVPFYSEEISLHIYNIQGQLVHANQLSGISGQTEISLNASNWSSGVYFLQAEANNLVQSMKFVVLK